MDPFLISKRTSVDKQRSVPVHFSKVPPAHLALREVLFDHPPNILAVVQVERRIHLVEDVQRGRLEPTSKMMRG